MPDTLETNLLKIAISSTGAELKSIYNKQNQQEYLWQGRPEWWPRSAPVLFPIVGKLIDNTYNVNGKSYSLPQHGFARDKEFKVSDKTENSITFQLLSDENSLKIYPFLFELKITYKIEGSKLEVTYYVKNAGTEPMYFSIGAHPGFICPMNKNEDFSDYYLEFEKAETLDRHLLDEGSFNGKTERILTNEKILNLIYELFKKDAIVFKNMKSTFMFLKSRKSDYALKFEFQDFPYFGIWTKPGAPFLCLEPWCGLADNKGLDADLKQKEGIIRLEKEKFFSRTYSIKI